MSLLSFQVELPAYSLSFHVQVALSSSVLDIKQEIFRTCSGAPRVEGQRIIWRGRLLKDTERVQDIWKTPDDSRIIHLAVHPSAWSTAPPEITRPPLLASPVHPSTPYPQSQEIRSAYNPGSYFPPSHSSSNGPPSDLRVNSSSLGFGPLPPMFTIPFIPPQMIPNPPPFITFKHHSALQVLRGELLDPATLQHMQATRLHAVRALEACGRAWPSIFDEDFPSPSAIETGLKYEVVRLNNLPYLSLTSTDSQPTPLQLHCLKVLTYTFPLISLHYPTPVAYSISATAQPLPLANVNAHLQQMGIQPLRIPQHQNPFVAEMRAFPVRALMPPLIMLALRTLLLFYFFSPARKPLFSILVGAWMLYEAWGAFRGAVGEGEGPDGARDRQGRRNAPAPAPAPAPAAPGPAPGPGPGPVPGAQDAQAAQRAAGTHTPATNPGRAQAEIILNSVANMYLDAEEALLAPSQNQLPGADIEPGMVYKVRAFLSLLITTLHPAVWNRRRTLLRQREGRLKMEANALESRAVNGSAGDSDPQAQARAQLLALHELRPTWVKEYVERARRGEWYDD